MTVSRRKQQRASHQANSQQPHPSIISHPIPHPTSLDSRPAPPYNLNQSSLPSQVLPLRDSNKSPVLPHAHHIATSWANPFPTDPKVESDAALLSASEAELVSSYSFSEEEDMQDDYKMLFLPQGSETQVPSPTGDTRNLTSPIVDLHQESPFKFKPPHRKEIEAKARLKMRLASQRLRHAITPRNDGITLRGTADTMERALEMLQEYETRIAQLEKELTRLCAARIPQPNGFYNTG